MVRRRPASAASQPSARSSAGSPCSRSAGCRSGSATSPPTASATPRRPTRTRCCSPTATRTRIPEALGPTWELPAHPVTLVQDDDGRRSRLTVFFRLLLAIPHFVWLALWTHRRPPRRLRELARRARARPLRRAVAPVPDRVHPLHRARERVRVPRRQPVPGLRRRARLSGRGRVRRGRAAEPLGDALPLFPSRSRRSCSPARSARPCSSWASWAGSRRSRPDGCRPASATSARSRSATERRRTRTCSSSPTRIRTRARRSGRRPQPSQSRRSSQLPGGGRLTKRRVALGAVVFLVLAGLWAAAAWSLWQSRGPERARARDGRPLGHRPADDRAREALRAVLPDRVRRLPARADRRAARLRALGGPLRPRVGGGPDRDGDAARDDRARARLDLAGAVPAGRGVVGPALRPDRQRLRRDAALELARSSAPSSSSSASHS